MANFDFCNEFEKFWKCTFFSKLAVVKIWLVRCNAFGCEIKAIVCLMEKTFIF